MARAAATTRRDRVPESVPPNVTVILRAELPSLADEMIAGIRAGVPEYGQPVEAPYQPAFRLIVEQAIAAFVDRISGSTASFERRDELCRALGRGEAYEGHSLDALQAAYRVGAQIAWRRVAEVGRRRMLSPEVMSLIADALFSYIDELASLSVQGYLEARARRGGARIEQNRLLLRLVLRRPRVARMLLAEAADEAGWHLPDEVTMVALPAGAVCVGEALHSLGADPQTPGPTAKALYSLGADPQTPGPTAKAFLAPDVLADLDAPEPHLLVPGPFDEDRAAMLADALPDRRAAVGITVPLDGAPDSLRWARQGLALVEAGVLDDRGPTLCEDHLLELWLLSDGALLDQVTRREFSELAGLGQQQQARTAVTLGAWLEAKGNAVETARLLRVHPQTVRYRMRQISATFGERLTDPDARFALEAVLRAGRLRDPSAAGH